MNQYGMTPREWRILRSLKSPERVQRFLDETIGYNIEADGETCYSPRQVLKHGVAHCMEGALVGAAALRAQGRPPLLLDLESVRDDDHVLAVFREGDCWGAVAKSNYAGLRFREPVYRTLRELVMSYFEHYYNLKGEKTLRAFSTKPVNLKRFDEQGWMASETDVWYIPEYLCGVGHTPILSSKQERKRRKMDKRSFGAGRFGMVPH